MEKTVSEQIIEVLNYMGEKMGVAIDWSAENVIPYIENLCRKYITWEIATSAFWIVLFLIFLVPLLKASKKLLNAMFKDITDNNEQKNWAEQLVYEDAEVSIGILAITVLLSFFLLVLIVPQVLDIIKCLCLPELQIYEYVSELIKSMN